MAHLIIPTEKYLLQKRAEIIDTLKKEDYKDVQIGLIMNLDRSTVGRIHRTYKKTKGKIIKSLNTKSHDRAIH